MYYRSGSLGLDFFRTLGCASSGGGAWRSAAAARMAASALGMLTSVNSFIRKSAVVSGVLGLWNR